MADTPKPWTDGEKLHIFFQIIEKAGPINYDELDLGGRTKKAVQVMIDREKTKMKKARAAGEGNEGEVQGDDKPKAKGKGKRKANDEASGEGEATKKPRKKKAAKTADVGGNGDVSENVKAEPEE